MAVAALVLGGCVTGGMDTGTRAALQTTIDKVEELTELWKQQLAAADGGGTGPETGPRPPLGPSPGSDLQEVGSHYLIGDSRSYSGWGFWGDADGRRLFSATISGLGSSSSSWLDPFRLSVTGARSYDNPVGRGRAMWKGKARGYERSQSTFGTPVEGKAVLLMDLGSIADYWIDVELTEFTRGHADLTWKSITTLANGRFTRSAPPGKIEGWFYGDKQEGVAGKFETDDLKGVFGAIREAD